MSDIILLDNKNEENLPNLENKNVLFLDIDGVLNTVVDINCNFHHVKRHLGRPYLKSDLHIIQECMDTLFPIIIKNNLHIVISSMWRFGAQPEWFSEMFSLYGYDIPSDNISFLYLNEYEGSDGERGDLIRCYVKEANIKNYIAIDDTSEHFKSDFTNLVITNGKSGIVSSDVDKLLQLIHSFSGS